MPIQANEGVLDIENATLRSNAIVTLTNFVTGNDVIRATGAPTLEVYGDPNNGGTEPTIEIVSNVDAGASSTFTRLTSNAGVFTIQSGTNAATDSRGDIAFTSIGGATETEHMRIHGSTGNVYVSSNLEVGTANLFVDTVNSRVGLGTTTPLRTLDIVGDIGVTANTSIFVGSNVVAEYTGPHDRPLRKYPEIILPRAAVGADYNGYRIERSSEHVTASYLGVQNIFNNTAVNNLDTWGGGWQGSSGAYSTSTGVHTTFVTGGAAQGTGANLSSSSGVPNGEWVSLQVSTPIKLDNVEIRSRNLSSGGETQFPKDFQFWGSDNGTTWYLIKSFTGELGNAPANIHKYNVNSTTLYNRFALVVTKIPGETSSGANDGQAHFSISELRFNAHEEGDSSLDTTLKSVYNVPGTQQLEVYYDAKDLTAMPSTVTDLSPNSNGGSVAGATLDTTDGIESFKFIASSSQYIEKVFSGYTQSAEYSASVWFKSDSYTADSFIFQLGLGDHGNGSGFGMNIKPEGPLRAYIYGYGSSAQAPTSTDSIVTNIWYHATATFYSSGKIELYVNGVLVGEGKATQLGTINASAPLTLGTYWASSQRVTPSFNGSIANFRLFSKALNAGQVQELYDYQKDYFLGSKSQVTLYKGHLGIGVAEPSGQLELAGDERLQEYPPGPMSDYETLIPGHGVFCAIASSTHYSTEGWKAFPPNSNGVLYWASGYGLYSQTSGAAGGVYAGSQRLSATTELGEYLILELPYKIILSKVFISARTSHTFKAPSNFTIYGSNNNSDWYTLLTVTGATPSQSGGNYYPGGGDSGTSTSIGDTTPYKYLAIVVSKTAGGSDIGDGTNSPGSIDAMMIANISYFGTPGPTTLDKGSLTLGRSLDVPRISRYDVDTETPRPEKLLLDFDTTVNSSPTDISGQGNHGAFYGGASYSAADKAFDLDGTNDVILGIISNPADDWVHSISFWFKLDIDQSTISTVKTENRIQPFQIARQGTGGVTRTTNLASGDLTGHVSGLDVVNSTFNWYFYGNDASFPISGIKANEWHHLTLAYEGGGAAANRHCFLDGVEYLNTGSSSANLAMFANSILSIGKDHARTASSPSHFPGQISNFKIYNVALEASEVRKLYNLGRTGRSVVISDTAVGIGKVPEAQLDVRGTIKGINMTSSPAAFSAAHTSSMSVGEATTIIWNDIQYNVGGCYNNSTGNFTAPISGYYYFSFHMLTRNDNETTYVAYFINDADPGTNATYGVYEGTQGNGSTSTSGGAHRHLSGSWLLYLSEGTKFKIVLRDGTSNGNLNRFTGFFVSS
jgi:hypothetical protein